MRSPNFNAGNSLIEGLRKEPPGTDAAEEKPAGLNRKKLLIRMAVALGLFLAILLILGRVYHDEFIRLSRAFVESLGGVGVALAFFLTDAFPIPLPPDPVMVFGSLGGMSFFTIVVWASSGSLLGGTLGFFIGKGVAKTRLFDRLIAGKRAEAYDVVRKYGAAGLAICALTPLPYCVASWASGALKMPYATFILVSLLRFVRVTFYMSLIHFGVVKLF